MAVTCNITEIIRTCIVVITIFRREHANRGATAAITGIIGAGITVIAKNNCVVTTTAGSRAKVNGTDVTVIAVFRDKPASYTATGPDNTEVSGAGVSVKTM